MDHPEHPEAPKEEKPRHIDDVVNPYSVWPSPPSYKQEQHYRQHSVGDYDTSQSFRSNAPETWVRPMQRIVQLPPEWIGKGVRGYCMPTVETEVSYIRNNDPEPWRVNTHEYFHFNYLGGGDGSEGFVHFLEHFRLGDEKHNGYH